MLRRRIALVLSLASLTACADELGGAPIAARTDAAGRPLLAAPESCEILVHHPGGSVLNAETLERSVEDVRGPVERALCACAAPAGLAAPADLSVSVTHHPAAGAIERVTVDLRHGDFAHFDWQRYEACVDDAARTARLPTWPLGSCTDPSSTDSRLTLGMPVAIR